jgi:hypothetical protein
LRTVEDAPRDRIDHGPMKKRPKISPTAPTIIRMTPTIGIATALSHGTPP